MNTPYIIDLLGGLRVQHGSDVIARFRTQKTGALLAYLAYHLNRTHAREELVDLLWPEADLESGRVSLRTALHALRSQLEPPGTPENSILLADRNTVRLNPESVTTDVAVFDSAIQAARRAENLDDKIRHLSRAMEVYRGPLLPGFYEDWATRERERLEALVQNLQRDLSLAMEQKGDLGQAIKWAQALVHADSLNEEAHCRLMQLFVAAGQPAAMLRQYEELKRILRRELNETPSPTTRALYEKLIQEKKPASVSASVSASAPLPVKTPSEPTPAPLPTPVPEPAPKTSTPFRHLPLQLTRFYGREQEVAEVLAMLTRGDTRLLTLTGPGGSGKTRLAIEVARQVPDSIAETICFVPLTDVSDPNLITGAILDAMGLSHAGQADPMEQIVETVSRYNTLLVLDSFEHLDEVGAAVVRRLLEQISTLTCLITSRHRLNLGGEREYPVPPLPVPTIPGTPEQLMTYPSVQLFVNRAQAVRPDFQITRDNATAVSALCERLEGIPLAIELASAWASMLTPNQMLTRLEHRFDLLTSRRKDLAPRHRTLRATIEWSYRLLPPELQRFFNQLALFRGGWSLEAAEAVCDEPDTLDYIPQLQERSFLYAVESGGEMRFRMLETLREYAYEQLTETDRNALAQRHLDFFTALADEAHEHYHGPDQLLWQEKLERELDNMRAALEWCKATPERAEAGLRLAGYLDFFWNVRGRLTEGYRWLTEFIDITAQGDIAQPGALPTNLRATALQAAGVLALGQGNLPASKAAFEEALALWRTTDDLKNLADTLCPLGLVIEHSDYKAAQVLFEEGIALYEQIGDEGGKAHALKCLGANALAQGYPERGRVLFQEALALYRKLDNPRGIVMMLREMANLALNQGEYERAEELVREHIALAHDLKDSGHTALANWSMAEVLRNRGDYGQAKVYYERCLDLYRELGDRRGIAATLNGIGVVAMEQGDYPTAHSLMQESLSIARELDNTPTLASLLSDLGTVAYRQGDYATARALYDESLTLYRQMADMWGIPITLRYLGHVAAEQGDFPGAQSYHKQSLALARELGNKHGVSMALYNLGELAYQQNDLSSARSYWQESVVLDKELGVLGGSVGGALGRLATRQGEFAEARRLWNASLDEHLTIMDRLGVVECLEGFAFLAHGEGPLERAATLHGAAAAARTLLGALRPSHEEEDYLRELEATRLELGEEAFARAYAAGQRMSLEEAAAYARTL